MYIDSVQRSNKVFTWFRDTSDVLHIIKDDAPYYCYVKHPDGEFTSLYGDTLQKKEFEDRNDMRIFKANSPITFESDISPVYKYLSDNFYGLEDNKINVGFFDIEVDFDLSDGRGFPLPSDPFGAINSMSLYDKNKEEYHMIMLHNDTSISFTDEDGLTVNTHFCVTEKQLLDTFFRLISNIDLLSAWNGDRFDIGYIVQRCMKLYGVSKGREKLCRDGFSIREYEKTDDFGNEYTHYDLVGRVHLDYLRLYKKFTFGERTSYSLDNISEHELKMKKLEYKGDLGDLYRTDPKTFFEYSLHDARLMKKLDDKLKFINLAIAMTKKATIKFNDVLGSIRYLEHAIMNYCHYDRENKLILPDKDPNNVRESFPGGFVIETRPNRYDWTCSIDLSGLYPAVMRAINISPETHLFQCENNQDDFVKIVEQSTDEINIKYVPTGEECTMTGFEIYKMLKDENFTLSAYGSIFDNVIGIIGEVLEIWTKERGEYKTKGIAHEKEGNIELGEYNIMMSSLAKLNNNSLYGAISNPYSRFYSIYLAASVTTTGQIIEKFQIQKADEIIENYERTG